MEEKNKTIINILINLGFLIAIVFICVLLTSAIIMLYKNMEIIRNDPITYVMKEMNFKSCVCELDLQEAALCGCYDQEDRYWTTFGKGFKNEESQGQRINNMMDNILEDMIIYNLSE